MGHFFIAAIYLQMLCNVENSFKDFEATKQKQFFGKNVYQFYELK